MQVNLITSRAICQDKFFQRQQQRKYKQHKKSINSMHHHKNHPSIQQFHQTKKITQSLQKAKSSAKKFKQLQTKQQIKRENQLLLKKIKCTIVDAKQTHTKMHKSKNNWTLKKKQTQQIKKQNQRLISMIERKVVKPAQYKKKMNKQIKQYLELKQQIRKCKYTSNAKNSFINLKLHSLEDKKDNTNNTQQKENYRDNTIEQTKNKQLS